MTASNWGGYTNKSFPLAKLARYLRYAVLAEQTEPTDEVEPDAVYHRPEPQVLGLPQRPGVRAREIALENATIPGA